MHPSSHSGPSKSSQYSEFPCLLDQRIHNNRYHLQERLGEGASGVVYGAEDLHPSTRPQVAIKCILRSNHARLMKSHEEVNLHQLASSVAGVVTVHDVFEEGDWLFIVLDYHPGDLFTLIIDQKHYIGRDELIKSVFLQLLDTVHDLHRVGIYHRDIKPENVLVNEDGSQVFLADFGLATEHEYTEEFGNGSDYYMSPECISGCYSPLLSSYSSRAADIWALGVILINMVTSRSPWVCADDSDPSFCRYTRTRDWLRRMLPLSNAAFLFVDKIFHNHGDNLNITTLRDEFLKIDTFYVTGSEFASASKAVQLLLRQWMPETYGDGAIKSCVLPPTTPSGRLDHSQSPSTRSEDPPSGHLRRSTSGYSSSSESEGPITPKIHALQVKDVVPDLAEGDVLGECLDLLCIADRPPSTKVTGFTNARLLCDRVW